jgi:NAD(P)-dependent dehydrogenase (short-subunit alcohol dehydrogenase family)
MSDVSAQRVAGKKALITGAAGGLGAATAEPLRHRRGDATRRRCLGGLTFQ